MEGPGGNVAFAVAISFAGTRRNYSRWSDQAREEGEGPQSWGPDRAREEGEGPQSCFWCPYVAALTRAACACALSL